LRTLPGGGLIIGQIIATDDHPLFVSAIMPDVLEQRALAAMKRFRLLIHA
jgi:hypothetical protein